MILHLAPDAPLIARLAADAALAGHIGGGTLGVAAGFVALSARKGERIHRAAGNVFFASMLLAYGVGAIVAPLIHQPANTFGGAFAFYLVATGWATVRRGEGRTGRFELVAATVVAAASVVLAAYAVVGARQPAILVGVPWEAPAIFAGLAMMAATCDLRIVRAGGLSGVRRVRRHVWRMCLAMFVGTGSLFLGQPKVFPEGLRGSPILWILALAPLAAMAFWLLRVRSGRVEAQPLIPAAEALS